MPKKKSKKSNVLQRHKSFSVLQIAVFVLIFGAMGAYAVYRSYAAQPSTDYIVVLKEGIDPDTKANKHAQAYEAQVKHIYHNVLKGYSANVPDAKLSALQADPDVLYVTVDTPVKAFAQTLGTGVNRVNAENKVNKGTGVNVAVIDTGIDTTHPDLAANIVGGINCSKGGGRSYSDVNGHGSHVAGIIAAQNNDIGVVGVAPETKLWSVRVLDAKGVGSDSDVICGIDFVDSKSPAKGGPIRVANMSLGGIGGDDGNCGNTNADPKHKAICQAVGDGVTFVVAAGNDSQDLSTTTPAAYDEVITVTALGDSDGKPCGLGTAMTWASDDTFYRFSNFANSAADQAHTIAAPGVNVYSTYINGGYNTGTGTSMASPHVAGAAALYIATHPGATPATVRSALKALGEPKDVNFNNECPSTTNRKITTSKFSHTDPVAKFPEVVLRADSL